MRIALCGASGTGKTTIVTNLSKVLGLPVCPVGSRSVAASMGFSSPYEVDAAGLRESFQRKLWAEKRDWELANPAFITDRTVFDNVVYSSLEGYNYPIEDLMAITDHMREVYTAVVFTPLTSFHFVGDDPARRQDLSYHRRFEQLLVRMLAWANIKYTAVSTYEMHSLLAGVSRGA
jgi:nicotinamide riboside kinase